MANHEESLLAGGLGVGGGLRRGAPRGIQNVPEDLHLSLTHINKSQGF